MEGVECLGIRKNLFALWIFCEDLQEPVLLQNLLLVTILSQQKLNLC